MKDRNMGQSRTATRAALSHFSVRHISVFSLCLLPALLSIGFVQQDDGKSLKDELPRIPATEPADAIKTFKLIDGFKVELAAAEPLVRRGRAAVGV
jgi:hypothetical protein